MATCHACPDDIDQADIANHARQIHPDADADPETWPDGGYVVVDLTLEPADFGADHA